MYRAVSTLYHYVTVPRPEGMCLGDTVGLPLCEFMGLKPSLCFSKLDAAELDADPLEADALDLVLAGEPLVWEDRPWRISWSTIG